MDVSGSFSNAHTVFLFTFEVCLFAVNSNRPHMAMNDAFLKSKDWAIHKCLPNRNTRSCQSKHARALSFTVHYYRRTAGLFKRKTQENWTQVRGGLYLLFPSLLMARLRHIVSICRTTNSAISEDLTDDGLRCWPVTSLSLSYVPQLLAFRAFFSLSPSFCLVLKLLSKVIL